MKVTLSSTQIPVEINKSGSNNFIIEGDASCSNGILHFGHEFTFTVKLKNGEPEFLGGWEIACEDIDYPKGKDGEKALEFFHPRLYSDVVTALKTITI